MSVLRIANGFEGMSDPNLLSEGRYIHLQMSTRTALFGDATPTMAELDESLNEFESAYEQSKSGDLLKKNIKDTCRQALIDLLHKESYYVLYKAMGDRSIVLQSGFKLMKERQPIVITKPLILKVANTDQNGQLLVKIKAVRGAKSYNYQYTTDLTLKEESWRSDSWSHSTYIIENLQVGTTYYVRVAAVGSRGQVMYSDVLSRAVS